MPSPERPAVVPPGAAPAAGNARPRVLVVDDEAGTRQIMVDMLTHDGGFRVVQARDGLEALARMREAPPDLVLLDVMMPGMDGRDVCRRLRGDPAIAAVPVILHSSADPSEVDWRGCGADAFLQKPFRITQLPAFVRRHLTTRSAADAPRPRPLTDDEIRAIAVAIREGVHQPPSDERRYDVVSAHHELSPEDEARVEAALLALADDTPEGAGRAKPARPRDRTRGRDDPRYDDEQT